MVEGKQLAKLMHSVGLVKAKGISITKHFDREVGLVHIETEPYWDGTKIVVKRFGSFKVTLESVDKLEDTDVHHKA